MAEDVAGYVHGYQAEESVRLWNQAAVLETLVHADTKYPDGTRVLEVGCGTGAQTISLARNNPGAEITAVDVSAASIAAARARIAAAGLGNVRFIEADLLDLPLAPRTFDHLFVCFVLEHLPHPLEALKRLRMLLRPGGSITVTEGDHGLYCLHPDSEAARDAVAALVQLQRSAGGDPHIGRRLHALLTEAGFGEVEVEPRTIYVDGARPDLADAFTRRTFTAMIEGVREAVIAAGLIRPGRFDEGIEALMRSAGSGGMFLYTFFRAVAVHRPG